MLSVICAECHLILSVVNQSLVLSVVMLNVIMQSVVTPLQTAFNKGDSSTNKHFNCHLSFKHINLLCLGGIRKMSPEAVFFVECSSMNKL
jgi:hypothetical protein